MIRSGQKYRSGLAFPQWVSLVLLGLYKHRSMSLVLSAGIAALPDLAVVAAGTPLALKFGLTLT